MWTAREALVRDPEQALWRLEHHAALGAQRLTGISDPRVVSLVASHLEPGADSADEDLQWLRAADSAC